MKDKWETLKDSLLDRIHGLVRPEIVSHNDEPMMTVSQVLFLMESIEGTAPSSSGRTSVFGTEGASPSLAGAEGGDHGR